MIKRLSSKLLLKKVNSFPVISLLGPRQCGKTTLIRSLFPDWKYLDLERPSVFTPLSEDIEARIKFLDNKIIFDEAQQLPLLFPVLRSFVDENRNNKGQFILLGSASPKLIKQISESLAGRTTFLQLTPFLYKEVIEYNRSTSIENLWFRGGFPDAFLMDDNQTLLDWFESYTRTFVERDLAALGINVSSQQMRKLWTMLAHSNCNVWNASKLAASMGINYQTANRYTDILEQTYLIRKLQPYYLNIKKRIIKSPKILFRDTGLLHYFLGIHNLEQLVTHPARGASWESFIIEQLIALFEIHIPNSRFYYWRTSGGAEVDLIIETNGKIIPIEIKLHSAPAKNMVKGLRFCMSDLGVSKGYIIYPGDEMYSLDQNISVIPAKRILLENDVLNSL